MKIFPGDKFNFKRKILIVDDTEIGRCMLHDILEDEYEVLMAENGKEAIDIMHENAELLSIVLLDLVMPVMDGYEVMNAVGKDSILSKIPIIVLTAEQNAEVKSLKMGAADFIAKPYEFPEVIKARIAKTIQLYESKNLISATSTDALTGLFRREYFMNYAEVADQHEADTAKDAIVININRFRRINELYGREYADFILKEIGKTLQSYVRGKSAIACRVGIDSFYIYISHLENAEEILDELSDKVSVKKDNIQISLRMGIYSNADKSIDVEKRFDCALFACNSIRNNFTKKTAYYDKSMHEKEAYEESLMADMERAIARKDFIVFYQPKYAIQSEKPCLSSAEALIRWKHPTFGMVSPGVFIPLFEKNGKIHMLDEYVWRQAAEQVAEWREKFGVTVPVSVNISRIDLMEDDFVGDILRVVSDAGISPEDYMLEITESAYMENSDEIINKVKELRERGFKIEMDDFGSGYSSLNMILTMPIDVLKLDRDFVKNIHEEEKNYRLVEIVMQIAKLWDVKVVAEGVETEEQHELLKKVGVDIIQGFYYSKPVAAEEFEEFFA